MISLAPGPEAIRLKRLCAVALDPNITFLCLFSTSAQNYQETRSIAFCSSLHTAQDPELKTSYTGTFPAGAVFLQEDSTHESCCKDNYGRQFHATGYKYAYTLRPWSALFVRNLSHRSESRSPTDPKMPRSPSHRLQQRQNHTLFPIDYVRTTSCTLNVHADSSSSSIERRRVVAMSHRTSVTHSYNGVNGRVRVSVVVSNETLIHSRRSQTHTTSYEERTLLWSHQIVSCTSTILPTPVSFNDPHLSPVTATGLPTRSNMATYLDRYPLPYNLHSNESSNQSPHISERVDSVLPSASGPYYTSTDTNESSVPVPIASATQPVDMAGTVPNAVVTIVDLAFGNQRVISPTYPTIPPAVSLVRRIGSAADNYTRGAYRSSHYGEQTRTYASHLAQSTDSNLHMECTGSFRTSHSMDRIQLSLNTHQHAYTRLTRGMEILPYTGNQLVARGGFNHWFIPLLRQHNLNILGTHQVCPHWDHRNSSNRQIDTITPMQMK